MKVSTRLYRWWFRRWYRRLTEEDPQKRAAIMRLRRAGWER